MAELICHTQQELNFFCASLSGIIILASLWFIYTFYQSFNEHKKLHSATQQVQLNSLVLYSCVIAVILEIISLIGVIMISISCIKDNVSLYDISAGIHLWAFCVLGTVVVGVCDVRLYTVFDSTTYAYPKYVFIFLATAFAITALSCFVIPILWVLKIEEFTSILVSIASFCYLIQAVSTLVLFVRGLFKIHGEERRRSDAAGATRVSSRHSKEQQKQQYNLENKLVETMCKYTVLACGALITTFVTGIIAIMRTSLTQFNTKEELPYMNIAAIWVIFDCIINILCLQWQFSFWKQNWYYFICHFPHICAKKAVTMKSMKKFNQWQQTQIAMSTSSNENNIDIDIDIEQAGQQSPAINASNNSPKTLTPMTLTNEIEIHDADISKI